MRLASIPSIEDEFFARNSAYDASMEAFGYVYVPQRCEPGTGVECRLHVFFHGCGMQVSVVHADLHQPCGKVAASRFSNSRR